MEGIMRILSSGSVIYLPKNPTHALKSEPLKRNRETRLKLVRMASMAFSMSYHYNSKNIIQQKTHQTMNFSPPLRSLSCEEEQQKKKLNDPINRRELILRSSELATLGAIFHFSGTKPSYLGVQKSPPSLALCPATNNCISTSESASDLNHYAPPWNYNPEGGRGSKNPVSKEVAMKELLEVIKSTKPDKFTPKIMEKKDDYVRVEYESPIMGFVDDVEFWFPPGKKSILEYRSASRFGSFDFDVNRKRIKALRQELEKKGWASEYTI